MANPQPDSHPRFELDKNVLIRMRDGIEIAVDVYRPDTREKVPAILVYMPYHKDGYAVRDFDFPEFFLKRGYAMVYADIRGTGGSTGAMDSFFRTTESEDGKEIVEWIAAQDWCTGNVGMTGVSYPGFTSNFVATLAAPHLKAIVPIDGTSDKYQSLYPNGNPRIFFPGYINAFRMAFDFAPPGYRDPEGRWAKVWEEHLEKNKPLFLTELAHQTWDSYHDESAMVSKAANIRAATYIIGGWNDLFVWQPFALYNAIPSGVPKKLLMGPWTHGRPDKQLPGPNIDYLGQLLKWFDQHLKGINTGIMDEPPITLFVNGYDEPARRRQVDSGEWRYEKEWPLKRASDTPMYLGRDSTLSASADASNDGLDTFIYDPTVGTASRLWNAMGWDTSLPADQRTDEMNSLVYTSPPMSEDTEVTGEPVATIFASTTTEVAAICVKLNDIAPDGRSEQISRRLLNLTHRQSHSKPEKLKPGEIYEFKITLESMSHVFSKGHRMRVAIAGADFPEAWPTPFKNVFSIYRNAKYPSRVNLPIVKSDSGLPKPNLGSPEKKGSPGSAAWSVAKWEVSKDVVDSMVTWEVQAKGGWAGADSSTREDTVSGMVTRVSSINPSHVIAKAYYQAIEKNRGEVTKIEADCFTRSDENAFHVSAVLKIYVNDLEFRTKSWTASYPRRLL